MGTSEHGTLTRFIVHRHRTGRAHLDLRLIVGDLLRSWSLLKEPPFRPGEQRLAVERESLPPEAIRYTSFEEQAFGAGRVTTWDEGEVEISGAGPELLSLVFTGTRLSGRYELRRTRWYPGNRWLLRKMGGAEDAPAKLP